MNRTIVPLNISVILVFIFISHLFFPRRLFVFGLSIGKEQTKWPNAITTDAVVVDVEYRTKIRCKMFDCHNLCAFRKKTRILISTAGIYLFMPTPYRLINFICRLRTATVFPFVIRPLWTISTILNFICVNK